MSATLIKLLAINIMPFTHRPSNIKNRHLLAGLSAACILALPMTIQAENLKPFNTWQEKSFVGNNVFSFSSENQISTVRIKSQNTSSALFLKQQINLNKTPFLHWQWKISKALKSVNEKTKKGDDFAVRVYVIASTGPFIWQTKTLSYVWSSSQEIGDTWLSPYSDKVVMLALNNGSYLQGSWQAHRRNIQIDLKNAFAETFDTIDVIAIMTDTDNTGQKTTGWYKNFYFSEE